MEGGDDEHHFEAHKALLYTDVLISDGDFGVGFEDVMCSQDGKQGLPRMSCGN